MIRVAINGFGQMGRNILRTLCKRKLQDTTKVVAINDLGNPEINVHSLKFDTTHGRFDLDIRQVMVVLKLIGKQSKPSQYKIPLSFLGTISMLIWYKNVSDYLHQMTKPWQLFRPALRKSLSAPRVKMSTPQLSMVLTTILLTQKCRL